jgi:PHD/YefM family antitoxin component YafN of YafNO toxin-antitoxin module
MSLKYNEFGKKVNFIVKKVLTTDHFLCITWYNEI